MQAFSLQQRVFVPDNREVCGERIKAGARGEIKACVDVLGTPIFRVEFDDGRILPMRAEEIQLEGSTAVEVAEE